MSLSGENPEGGGESCPKCGGPLQTDEQGGADPLCIRCNFSVALWDGNLAELGDGTTLPFASHERTGRKVAHFALVRELGSGSFGHVWLAFDTELDREVALKLPRIDTADSMGFREAKMAAKLSHPNIVSVYEVGQFEGQVYIASEYIRGETLAEEIKRGRLDVDRTVQILSQLAAAADHAHNEGVVHRDLKPSNVLLRGDGEPVIADFGIAKQISVEETISSGGFVVGTIPYMSPEQASGSSNWTDHRADIYSLGVLMFEMLTQSVPFRGNVEAIIRQKTGEDAPSPKRLVATVPADLETICLKCLERDRGRRYKTARELGAELERFSQGRPILSRPISSLERCWRWCKRQPAIAALLLGVVLSLSIGMASSNYFRIRAEHNALMTQKELYRSQMNLVGTRWHDGDLLGVRQILAEDPLPRLSSSSEDFAYRYFTSELEPVLRIVNHGVPLSDVAVSHDGSLLASAGEDRYIRVWHAASGRLVRTLEVASGSIVSIQFSPRDNRLASAHSDGRIRIWNPQMHEEVLREMNHGSKLGLVRFFPDGQRLLSAAGDGQVRIRRIDADPAGVAVGEQVEWTIPFNGQVVDARITRDGQLLAVASEQGRVSVFDLAVGKPTERQLPACPKVLCLSFSGEDESRLVACTESAVCRIYSLADGQVVRTAKADGAIGDAEYLPGTGLLALAISSNSLKLYDEELRMRHALPTHTRTFGMLALSADGRSLVAGSNDGTVKLFDVPALERPSVMWHDSSLRDVVFLDNKRFAAGAENGAVVEWHRDSGERRILRRAGAAPVRALAAIDSGRLLALGGAQHQIEFVETGTAGESSGYSIALEFAGVTALDYLESEGLLAVGSRSGRVQIFRPGPDAEPVWEFQRFDAEVNDLCWSQERNRIAIAFTDQTLLTGDYLADGQFRERSIELPQVPSCVASFEEGEMIAIGTQTGDILLVSLTDDVPVRTIKGNGNQINSLHVLPNGTQIVSGGMDRHLHLWDLFSGKLSGSLGGNKRRIFRIAVSPDGRAIVSVGLSGDAVVRRGPVVGE